MTMHSVVIIFISAIIGLGVGQTLGATILEDSKFQNFIVYIKDDVPEENGDLLVNIMTYMKRMSSSLWKATNALADGVSAVQLGRVIIRIPPTWRQRPDSNISVKCTDVSAFITSATENGLSNEPFTKQTGSCGEPGNSTRYPHSFFIPTNDSNPIEKGKIMMNEFVKMRYGVFSEKPYRNMLTVFDGEKFVLSSCGANIPGMIREPLSTCTVPDNTCSFIPDKNYKSDYSVLFDTESNSNEYFCNDKTRPHNRLAKSLQNIKCDGLSVSSVILQHNDFKIPRRSQLLQPVTFHITKGQSRRIVLVIDLSSSMNNILRNVKLAVIEFLNNKVENSAEVGLVSFSTRASIDSPLLVVANGSNKVSLVRTVQSWYPSGWTNIGDGLMKAVQVLGGDINTTNSVEGTIILLSDGYNNQDYGLYKQRIETVISKGILVNVITYGTTTDSDLNRLTSGSGGQFLQVDPYTPYTNLLDRFSVKGVCDSSLNSSIKVLEKKLDVVIKNESVKESILKVDPFVGKDLLILVTFMIDTRLFNIYILDPDNVKYSYFSNIYQQSGTTLSFKIPGITKEGEYFLLIGTHNVTTQYYKNYTSTKINIVVSATPDPSSRRIINPTGQLSSSQIDLVTANTSVKVMVDLSTCGITKNEVVNVMLRVRYPYNRESSFIMRDNGLGPDSVAGDRIFTVELHSKQLMEVGFYSFQALVEIRYNWNQIISRSVDFGTLRVLRIQMGRLKDVIPPARIDNVNIVTIDPHHKLLKMEFLATGDDGMDGNISKYVIGLDNGRDPMQFKTVNIATVPLQAMSVDLHLIAVTFDTPFKLYVRGVDESDNAGRWSPAVIYSWQYENVRNRLGGGGGSLRPIIHIHISFH